MLERKDNKKEKIENLLNDTESTGDYDMDKVRAILKGRVGYNMLDDLESNVFYTTSMGA